MPTYSNSRLSTYQNCPQKYKFKYIDHIKLPEEEEGVEAFLGLRVHETLERLHRELLLTKLNSLDDSLEYYNSQWEKNWHENVVVTSGMSQVSGLHYSQGSSIKKLAVYIKLKAESSKLKPRRHPLAGRQRRCRAHNMK